MPAPFDLVRALVHALNRDQLPDEVLGEAVELVRSHFGLARATLWRRAPSGTQVVGISAPAGGPPAEFLEQTPPDTGIIRFPVLHAGIRLGALELVPDRHGPAPDRDLVYLVAEVMAPFLDSVLLSEDLAAEVATRSRELQEQRRITSLIIDSLPLGIYVIDRDYRIVLWNRKRETGTQGLRRDQALGRRVFDVLTRHPMEQLKAEYDSIFETGELVQRDQVVDLQGEGRVFRQTKIPMRLDGSAISHVITIGEDMTERRLAEARILQSEKLAALGQLAAGVMHEINNPLATIGACVAAIEARLDKPDSTVEEYLDIIEREVHRCTRIVDQLLDFSRPRSFRPSRVPTDVHELLQETLLLLKHHQRFKKLNVVQEFAPDLPRAVVDGERIIQAFMAIMLNAADAMDRGGTLRIRTGANGARDDEVMVEFADTGAGIPAEALDKIFEPFYTTKPPGRGTGLGLTICYGILEENGGRITVESQAGLGTTFRLYVPREAPASP
ncbi:MAG TPA: ATP-binding protein [Gemmatimonadales bacterium]|nr:ATP-binding protein [Gemmatimonadales bacterium]